MAGDYKPVSPDVDRVSRRSEKVVVLIPYFFANRYPKLGSSYGVNTPTLYNAIDAYYRIVNVYKYKNNFDPNNGRISPEKIGAFMTHCLNVSKPLYLTNLPDGSETPSEYYEAALFMNREFALQVGFAYSKMSLSIAESELPKAMEQLRVCLNGNEITADALVPIFELLAQYCRLH